MDTHLDNQNTLAKDDATDQIEKNEVSLDQHKEDESHPCKEQTQDDNLEDSPAKLEEGKTGGEENNNNENIKDEENCVAAQQEKENEPIDEEALNSSIQEEELQSEENEEMQQEEDHSSEGDENEEGEEENDDAINEEQEQQEENEEEGSNHRNNNEDDSQSNNDGRVHKSPNETKLEEEALKNSVFLENLIREYQHQQQLQSEQKVQSQEQSQPGQVDKENNNRNEKPLDNNSDMVTAQQESQILQLLIEQLKYQQQSAQQQELDSASKEKEHLEQQNTQNQSNSEKQLEADEEMREEEQDEIEDQREDEDDEEEQEQQLQNEKLNINGYQQLEEETVMALINEANKLQAYLANPQLSSEQRSLAESKHAACLVQLKKLQQLIHAESLNPALLLQSLASSQQQQQALHQQKSQNLFQSATSGSNNHNYSAFKNDQQQQQNHQNHPLVNFFNSYSLFINDTSNVQLDQEVVLNKLIDNAKKCKPPSNADERVNVLWEYLTDLDKKQIESFENQLRSLPEQNIYECIQTIEKLHIKLLVEYNMEVARGKNLGIIKQ